MNKRNNFLLCAIGFLQGMVFYAPVATLYRQAAGVGIFQITLIESVSLILSIMLEIPWGILADRIGYRKTMLICCGLFFVSKILFWQAEEFGMFLLERILLGVTCAGLSGVDAGMLFLSCGEGDSHRVFGVYEYLQQMGLLLAAGVFSLWIGSNYRLAGLLTVLSYGAAALLALFLQEVKPMEKTHTGIRKSMRVLIDQLQDRKLLCFLIGLALVNEIHQTVTVFLNQLQYIRAGMTAEMISAAFILLSMAGLTSGFSARLCAGMGAKRMGSLLILTSLICCGTLAITVQPVLSVLAVVGLRLSYSQLQPLQLEQQNRRIHAEHRATALSMNAMLMDSISIFLNLLLGSAAEVSLPGAMLLGVVLCIASLVLYRRSW